MLRKCSRWLVAFWIFMGLTGAVWAADDNAPGSTPPEVGQQAAGFGLKDLEGKTVAIQEQLKQGPVVLVVLRGYPGYQCPICTRQVGQLVAQAKKFAEAKATVVLVYPGPAADLDKHAKEFVGSKEFPVNFRFVIDPDYKFTELYHLRWNAPAETAYPSSFVIDRNGVIRFAKISKTHGGRASTAELLEALTKLGE